jgi:hypothetical protein
MVDAETAIRYRQYAEDAVRYAGQALTEKDKLALLDLARTWGQVAARYEAKRTRVAA